MESVRLTKSLREKITWKLLQRKYGGDDGPIATFCKDSVKLADDIYKDVLGKKDLILMSSLPKGWLPEVPYLQAEIAGQFSWLYFNGEQFFKKIGHWEFRMLGLDDYKVNIHKPLPALYQRGAAKYDGTHALAVRFRDLENKAETLGEELERDFQELKAALSQFSTSKRLLTEWPEIESIFHECYGSKPVRDIVKVVDLNAKFDLPVRELEAA